MRIVSRLIGIAFSDPRTIRGAYNKKSGWFPLFLYVVLYSLYIEVPFIVGNHAVEGRPGYAELLRKGPLGDAACPALLTVRGKVRDLFIRHADNSQTLRCICHQRIPSAWKNSPHGSSDRFSTREESVSSDIPGTGTRRSDRTRSWSPRPRRSDRKATFSRGSRSRPG